MKDKTQYEAFMEELKKLANNFRDVVTELGDILAKILPDVEIPDEEEEDTWEMKCPYEDGDEYWFIKDFGDVFIDSWDGCEIDMGRFNTGNVFPTKQAAELEAKRRNLLTRFRSFRDERNGDWKADWKSHLDLKYYISFVGKAKLVIFYTGTTNNFQLFGFFKNQADCERAIELFGDEIIELFVEGDA